METTQFIYKKETYNIIGAAMEVHKTLGMGFLESVYQEAMEVEMAKRSIPFVSQKRIQIQYKDVLLNQYYIADLFCYDKIIVELGIGVVAHGRVGEIDHRHTCSLSCF